MSERYDKPIKEIEKLVKEIYRSVTGVISEAVSDLLDSFIPKTEDDATDDERRKAVLAAFVRLKKKDLADVLEKVYEANKQAKDTINDEVPAVFSDTLSYELYDIEMELGEDIGLVPFDEEDCEEWLDEDDDIYPVHDLNERKDKRWNEKNLRNLIVAGVILKLTHDKLTKYVTTGMVSRNRNSMLNNAFTVLSGAGEAGKESAWFQSEDKGAEMVKEWIATLDFKTREEHRDLDGRTVPVNAEFAPGLRYPRDPNAPAHQRCNCRCSMNRHIKGWKSSGQRRENIRHYREDGSWYKPLVNDMTYSEWYQMKVDELGEVEIKRQVKQIKREQQQKYYRKRKRQMKEGA